MGTGQTDKDHHVGNFVSPNNVSAIRKEFLRKAKRVHPDKQRHNERANEEFCVLKEDYERLVEATQSNHTASRNILVEHIPLEKWKRTTTLQEMDNNNYADNHHCQQVYFETYCRCGGLVTIEADNDEDIRRLLSNNDSTDYLIPCDNCSLYIQLGMENSQK